jgi:hypothetical protein
MQVPLTPPQHVHFDPANGMGQSFTCGSYCYFQLCVGPGLSREQRPVLNIHDNCDSLGGWRYASGPAYIAPLGVFIYQFSAYDCHITVTLEDILPVELVSFTAAAGDQEVVLHWQTASENNNAGFEIMRNGLLAHTEPASNSPTGSSYNWTDYQVSNGTTYDYTLVSVALDGAREDLKSVSATPIPSAATVMEYALHQNYPNPFNPSTEIVFDMKENGPVNLKVYNLMGQEVTTLLNGNMNQGRHSISFNAANLPSGVYIYRMEANGFSAQNKMLLMK